MNLTNEITNRILFEEFWNAVHDEYIINEAIDNGLSSLLNQANSVVFDKFNIKSTDKVYFIGGSARLYLYPEVLKSFGINSNISDLDIVLPNKELWVNAGLEKEYNNGGIYRPEGVEIEVFNEWLPNKAGGQYSDVKVRPTNQILRDSTLLNGYYFMRLDDIADYKLNLGREKEKEFVNLVKLFLKSPKNKRIEILRKIISITGLRNTKNFFSN